MQSTLHLSTWSRSEPAASSAVFICSRISSACRSNGAWAAISPVSGSNGGMPDTNTICPARVQADTGAPHFSKLLSNGSTRMISRSMALFPSPRASGPVQSRVPRDIVERLIADQLATSRQVPRRRPIRGHRVDDDGLRWPCRGVSAQGGENASDEIAIREPHGSKPAQVVLTLRVCFDQAGLRGAGGADRFRTIFAGLAPTDAEQNRSEGASLRFDGHDALAHQFRRRVGRGIDQPL